MNKPVETICLIRTELERRGRGTDEDPVRIITQYWKEGALVFEIDPEDPLRKIIKQQEDIISQLRVEAEDNDQTRRKLNLLIKQCVSELPGQEVSPRIQIWFEGAVGNRPECFVVKVGGTEYRHPVLEVLLENVITDQETKI